MGYTNVLVIILLVVITSPVVFGNDAAPIPQNSRRIEQWFNTNVPSLASKKDTLDPDLLTAEASPRVRQDGRGHFKTLTEAIASVPAENTKRVIINLGPGVYKEKVTIDRNKPFITLYGHRNAMPVMTFDGTAAQYGTVDSATLIVLSDYFMAVNIIVKNSAPMPDGKMKGAQALSMRISGNKAAFYNSKFYGYQDTICDDAGNHFFKDCYIEGTYDFIFGSGRSLYLRTQLNVVGDGLRVITAHAGKSAGEKSEYSFVHCKVTGTGTGIYLGRAWMSHPKVVYAYTDMSSVVNPSGWQENPQSERDKTVFYGEYKCSGAGSKKEKRFKYTQDIDSIEANYFISLGYIQGSTWLLPPPSL
ncbi:unnamed protein product [Microthlaspi erraticum]|uniref:pectinesterase n=1 Tax=Microthlaspi erraticum TaxID=1685480 RepID=A0A6D2I3B9_9BRAS|nr:unnamed protein product [Microthlaspi erraticum]